MQHSNLRHKHTQTHTRCFFMINRPRRCFHVSSFTVRRGINCLSLFTFLSFFTSTPPFFLLSPPLFAPFHLFLTLWFSDWRLQIACEFHHKTPLCSYCPCCLLPNTHRSAYTHARLALTCNQNLLFRVTINKSMSETIGEKGGWERSNGKKIAKSEKIFIEASDAHKSTKAHRAEGRDKNG